MLCSLDGADDCKAVLLLYGLPAEGPQEEAGSVAQAVGQCGVSFYTALELLNHIRFKLIQLESV